MYFSHASSCKASSSSLAVGCTTAARTTKKTKKPVVANANSKRISLTSRDAKKESSRRFRTSRAIADPSSSTTKTEEKDDNNASSMSGPPAAQTVMKDGEKETIKRAPRPATLNRPLSQAAVDSNAALANLKAAGGANGTYARVSLFFFSIPIFHRCCC